MPFYGMARWDTQSCRASARRTDKSEIHVTPRPLKGYSLKQIRERVDEIRHELSRRRSYNARKLREEIEPKYADRRARDCRVYVIELSERVRADKTFVEANPNARSDRPCLYVGSTSKTAEERFDQHKAGKEKFSRRVRDHGIGLRPEFAELIPLMPRDEVERTERRVAHLLRREGYAVWQA